MAVVVLVLLLFAAIGVETPQNKPSNSSTTSLSPFRSSGMCVRLLLPGNKSSNSSSSRPLRRRFGMIVNGPPTHGAAIHGRRMVANGSSELSLPLCQPAPAAHLRLSSEACLECPFFPSLPGHSLRERNEKGWSAGYSPSHLRTRWGRPHSPTYPRRYGEDETHRSGGRGGDRKTNL